MVHSFDPYYVVEIWLQQQDDGPMEVLDCLDVQDELVQEQELVEQGLVEQEQEQEQELVEQLDEHVEEQEVLVEERAVFALELVIVLELPVPVVGAMLHLALLMVELLVMQEVVQHVVYIQHFVVELELPPPVAVAMPHLVLQLAQKRQD
jgi:hypothetical protein